MDKLMDILDKRGITGYRIAKETGISANTFSKIRTGKLKTLYGNSREKVLEYLELKESDVEEFTNFPNHPSNRGRLGGRANTTELHISQGGICTCEEIARNYRACVQARKNRIEKKKEEMNKLYELEENKTPKKECCHESCPLNEKCKCQSLQVNKGAYCKNMNVKSSKKSKYVNDNYLFPLNHKSTIEYLLKRSGTKDIEI